MTTAENNISALTGGIDVGNLENRINELDEEVRPIFTGSYIRRYRDYGGTTLNYETYLSDIVSFTCSNYETIRVKVIINATLPNDVNNKSIILKNYLSLSNTINLSNLDINSNIHVIDYTYTPKNRYEELYVSFNNCEGLVLNKIEFEIYGTELKEIKNYRDLNVICFNNYRYLTYYKNGTYYYGKYAITDTIDLDNIPNTFTPTDTNDSLFYAFVYTPAIKVSSDDTTLSNNADGYLFFSPKKHFINAFTPPEDDSNKYYTQGIKYIHGLPVWGYKSPYTTKLKNGVPAGANMNIYNGYSEFSNILNLQKGEWLLGFDLINNYLTDDSQPASGFSYQAMFLNENGYIYLAPGTQLVYTTKIAKGEFAIGYKQQDNTYNVYITKRHKVYKYKLAKNISSNRYEPSLIKTYEKCDLIYEILNNQIIKYYKGSWSVISEENNVSTN